MSTEQLTLDGVPGRRILRLYNLYRVIIGLALVLLISSDLDDQLLELAHAQLFRYGSWTYLILNVLVAVLLQRPSHLAQVFSLALLDVLLLCTLFFAAGGTPSGIGNLLIVAVAIGNILLRGRIGLLIAAVAAIGMLALTFYLSLLRNTPAPQFVQAGALGALCFAAAIFLQGLASRLQQSEFLAEQRAVDVASLEALNSLILQRMRTGILVLDKQHRVLLANQGALSMLGRSKLEHKLLDPHCPELVQRLQQWQHNPTLRPQSLQAMPDGPLLQPSFIPLQRSGEQHTLIFLDDISQVTQQAQQLKLASLGRLTAGIAHEIRNPLGVIHGSAQIVVNRDRPWEMRERAARFIIDEVTRLDATLRSFLTFARPAKPSFRRTDLLLLLEETLVATEARYRSEGYTVVHDFPAIVPAIEADPDQIRQVVWNVTLNALKAMPGGGVLSLRIHVEPGPPPGHEDAESPNPVDAQRPWVVVTVADSGCGIADEHLHDIFDPFVSYRDDGTGLGLSIVHQLVRLHRGEVRIRSRLGEGTVVALHFPCAEEAERSC